MEFANWVKSHWLECVVVVAVLVVICATVAMLPPQHVTGYVLSKEHTPAKIDYRFMPVFGGKNVRYALMPVAVPEEWRLEIHTDSGRTVWRQVTSDEFDKTNYGERYSD